MSHPVLLTHPITGRKVLYCNPGFTDHIDGMPRAESKALLAWLFEFQLQERFRYTHHWTEKDLLIWDNLATMHSATPTEYTAEEGKRRSLLRFSTTGLPPLYADRTPPFVR